MRRAYRHGLAPVLLVCAPAMSLAQAAPPCPAMVAPGGALAAWTVPVDRAGAGDAAHLGGAGIALGQALHLALLPQGQVKFALQPGRTGAAGSYAGLLHLTVSEPGTYRIALGTGAWVDLVDNTVAVASSAHGHGPACSGIRKIVDFPLHAGGYIVQISANAEPQTHLLVVRVP